MLASGVVRSRIEVYAMAPIPELPLRLIENARLLPNRFHILDRLPHDRVVAEVGVATGGFSRQFLDRCRPRKFIAIDSFTLHLLPSLWGRPIDEYFHGQTHGDSYRAKFAPQIAAGLVEVLEGDSATVMETLPDASIDVFYVDADHGYEGVKRDLDVIRRKIRPDGTIIMNDYTFLENVGSKNEYGVIQATHEFMLAEDWEMTYLALERHMFCDVALRKWRPGPAAA
jgi:hypothetical protein